MPFVGQKVKVQCLSVAKITLSVAHVSTFRRKMAYIKACLNIAVIDAQRILLFNFHTSIPVRIKATMSPGLYRTLGCFQSRGTSIKQRGQSGKGTT